MAVLQRRELVQAIENLAPTLREHPEELLLFNEELVKQGHDVTLFGSGDSVTRASLVPICDKALRLDRARLIDPLAHHFRMLEMVFRIAHEFDVIHFRIV